jgi:glycosyltransferase involved in cell wall biosynthesis
LGLATWPTRSSCVRVGMVSVIVPARNAERSVRALLGSLKAQTLPRESFEVIVVDDRSTDGTAAVAVEAGVARVVRAPGGNSYVARNLGVAVAAGDVLAFADADCVPAPDWIERGVSAVRGGDSPLVAGRVEVPLLGRPRSVALVDFARYLCQERNVVQGFAATANLWVTRDAFDSIGRFNDRLRSGGDIEFGLRAGEIGLSPRYAPDVIVTHEPRATPGALARKEFRIGYGIAQQRRFARAPLRDRDQPWRRLRSYFPRKGISGFGRIERLGWRPSVATMVSMHAVQYLFVDLPQVAGNRIRRRYAQGRRPARRRPGGPRQAAERLLRGPGPGTGCGPRPRGRVPGRRLRPR